MKFQGNETTTLHTWRMMEAASPLGSVEQWQWCNSVQAGNRQCGPLAGMSEAVSGAAPFFNTSTEDLEASNPTSEHMLGALLT
jgi:hypothetical protein